MKKKKKPLEAIARCPIIYYAENVLIANLSTAKLERKATQKLKTADRMKTDAEILQ